MERTEVPGQQDRETFAEVVDACYERIFRGVVSVTGDAHLAEEIVQETFVLAFRKFDSYSGNSSPFTWLYGTMLNKYRDHCRRKKLLRRLGFVRSKNDAAETKNVKGERLSLQEQLANRSPIQWRRT